MMSENANTIRTGNLGVNDTMGTTGYKTHSAASSIASFDDLLKKEKRPGSTTSTQRLEGPPQVKFFESPLAHDRRGSAPEAPPSQPAFINISGPTHLASQNALGNTLQDNIFDDRQEEHDKGRLDDAYMRETPEFKRYEEATNIELFYDLFFVANLTTFTEVHDINEVAALKAYAGFFCILWFLWAQVSLFDVRFVQDSILERIGKACQFGVMIGLAIIGPDFDPDKQDQQAFRSLAIVLMISRIILGFQYMVVLHQVWHYKNTKFPLSIIVAANFVAALVYFATLFGFKADNRNHNVFIVWYVTAILETAVNIGVSSRWKVLTFAGTHLVKRMSLLTLIILGEGVIALAKSIATITEQEETLDAPLIGTIVSAVIIIYFIYMLYFDWLSSKHFGSFREGLWAFVHFPFHLALVLLMEGAAQFILWRKVVEVITSVNEKFLAAESTFTGMSSVDLSLLFSNVTSDVFKSYHPKFTHTLEQAQNAVYGIGNTTFNSTEQLHQMTTLFAVIQDSLFENFGIDPPEVQTTSTDPNEEFSKNMGAFMLVFIYFFIAAGLTLLLMNILSVLSHPLQSRGDYNRMAANFVIAITLSAVASIVNTEDGLEFAQSAWILPSVAMAFVLVTALTCTKLLQR